MKPKKYGPILLVLAIASFITAIMEGFFYYARYSQYPLFRLLMTLENGVKAFVFMPAIGIERVLDSMKDAPAFQQVVGYAYGAAIFIAPLCTATALLILAELTARRLVSGWRRRKGTPVLIFGWNENVRGLVNGEDADGSKKYQIHVVTAAKLSNDDELWLLRRGAVYHRMDLLSAPKGRREKLLRQMPVHRIKRVLLMEDSPTRNFSLYRLLSEDASPLKQDVSYYCLCEEDGARSIIEDACDQRLDDGVEGTAELILFSLAEMKADSIFSALSESDDSFRPLHTVNTPDKRDVHLLIAGFGTVGQQVLLQAINLGVLSSRSRLCIDVVDLDMDRNRELFTNRFHDSVDGSPKPDELLLQEPTADGELLIRFHQTDVRGQSFARLLEQLNEEMPLTYAAVCMSQADVGMHCIVALRRLEGSFPIALRMENDLQIASYLKQNDGAFQEVFPVAVSDRMLRMANICDEERERMARKFHRTYAGIQLLPPGKEPDDQPFEGKSWGSLKMYQRRANVFLYRHQAVKDVFGKLDPAVWERCFGKDGTLLQRLDNGRYRCSYDGPAMAAAINAEPEIRELAMTEHRRWCYVMAMQGWRYGERKDEFRRKTPYLVTWDELCRSAPEMAVYDLIAYLTEEPSGYGNKESTV